MDRSKKARRKTVINKPVGGGLTLSELSAMTGVNVEYLADAFAADDGQGGLDMFLAGCRSLAEAHNDPEFLQLAERAVAQVRSGH